VAQPWPAVGITRSCRRPGRPRCAPALLPRIAGAVGYPAGGLVGRGHRRSCGAAGHRLRCCLGGAFHQAARQRWPERSDHVRSGTGKGRVAADAADEHAVPRSVARSGQAADADVAHAVPSGTPAGVEICAIHGRLQRSQSTRGKDGLDADGAADGNGNVHDRRRDRALPGCSSRSDRPARDGHQRYRTSIRRGGHEHHRLDHRRVGREVPLRVLASDHRHPARRHRREPGHGGRHDVGAAGGDPAVSGLRERVQRCHRRLDWEPLADPRTRTWWPS
jgi:hypothetical protein